MVRAFLVAVMVPLVALGAAGAGSASSAGGQDRLQIVASGLDQPVDVVAAPGQPDRLYVVERAGKVVVVRDGKVAGTFLDLTSLVYSKPTADGDEEDGLLSIAFSPAYGTNHRFYVDYTIANGDTRVVEYQTRAGAPDLASARPLLDVRHRAHRNHNGGDLQFDRNGMLYLGMGDGDLGAPAQDLRSPLGKLLRVNPLQSHPRWQTIGYGLRNPWRYSFDSKTGDLWIADVGEAKWEEIDYRPAAQIGALANYGWPIYEGNSNYPSSVPLNRAGVLVKPLYTYSHQNGACAVIGGYVYRGTAIPADQGRYFFGDFCNGDIWMLSRAGGRAVVTREPFTVPELSAFGEAANGDLYLANFTGTLYRLVR
jgi:glucose/arabinose dehydrogenase